MFSQGIIDYRLCHLVPHVLGCGFTFGQSCSLCPVWVHTNAHVCQNETVAINFLLISHQLRWCPLYKQDWDFYLSWVATYRSSYVSLYILGNCAQKVQVHRVQSFASEDTSYVWVCHTFILQHILDIDQLRHHDSRKSNHHPAVLNCPVLKYIHQQ